MSGKTYTLLGNIQDNGILLDYMYGIFDYMDENNLKEKTTIYMSCIEYSDEKFKDLLIKTNYSLDIYENLSHEISLMGLSKIKIDSLKDGLKLLRFLFINFFFFQIYLELQQKIMWEGTISMKNSPKESISIFLNLIF